MAGGASVGLVAAAAPTALMPVRPEAEASQLPVAHGHPGAGQSVLHGELLTGVRRAAIDPERPRRTLSAFATRPPRRTIAPQQAAARYAANAAPTPAQRRLDVFA